MRRKNSVVIVYENVLLGEGISRYILTHTGVKSRLVLAHDGEGIESALASHPQVVIFGLEEPSHRIDFPGLDPRTTVIDMRDGVDLGPAIPPEGVGMERIVQAVLGLRGGRVHPIPM